MGDIKRILYNKEIKDKCDWYNDKISLETNESLHFHWKNVRLEFGHRDWEEFCKSVVLAYDNWISIGKPPLKSKNNNENTVYLPVPRDINPISQFYPKRFQIEEQSNVPTIHIHYRELRLEFGIPEFLEFAEGINKAKEEIENGDKKKNDG